MRAHGLLPLLLFVAATPAAAQSEDQLRDAFEGKTVVVRIDMPATARGVDIRPLERRPLNTKEYADRIKDYGTALRAGTSVMVTKIRVKKDLIEFQLGGGGYGTFGDDRGDVYVSGPGKSTRERNLEKDLKDEKDPRQRKAMQEELDKLRRDREGQEALVKATAVNAEIANKARIQEKALAAGSRFNVRFSPVVPPEALTPEGLRRVLAEYVDFAGGAAAAAPGTPVTVSAPVTTPGRLHKGMLLAEVQALYGEPVRSESRLLEGYRFVKSTYTTADGTITAEFVEGVLVRFSLSSN